MRRPYTEGLASKVKNRLLSKLYLDLNPGYKSSIFLAGSGRSGTTWISEIINYDGDHRYIFEPFDPDRVGVCKNFRIRQYLRPDNAAKEFIEPAGTILSGRIRSGWTDRFHKKFIYDKRLIKDIRANLLLYWIRHNFPEVPIILLLRHPLAVASSALELNWDVPLEGFLDQTELMEDFLNPYKQRIEGARTGFEKHIFFWCIENYVPIKQFERGEIHLAFYENFCENPEQEISNLFSFLGKDYDETVFETLKKPSPLARKESAIISGGRLVDSWRRRIDGEQVRRAAEILGLFGLDEIYGEDPMPNVDGAYSLMRAS